jgi:hypothetical protein
MIQGHCTFCDKYTDIITNHYDRGRDLSTFYWPCVTSWRAAVIFVNSFDAKLPLINTIINRYLITDIKNVLYQALISNMHTWVPECVQLQQQQQLERKNYVSIKYKSMNTKQLISIITERGLKHPKNASKSKYQGIIQRDIDAKRKLWNL